MFSAPGTLVYSQDRIQKNIAPVSKAARVSSTSVEAVLYSSLMTVRGIAFS